MLKNALSLLCLNLRKRNSQSVAKEGISIDGDTDAAKARKEAVEKKSIMDKSILAATE